MRGLEYQRVPTTIEEENLFLSYIVPDADDNRGSGDAV